MKFIINSLLTLLVLAIAIGAATYGVMSANVKQSGTISLAQQNLAKQTLPVGAGVEQVEMNGPFDLAIIRADSASMTLEGEARLLPKVVVQQDGDVLRINTKGMLITNNQTVKIILMLPKLTALRQFGSGDSEVHGFAGPELVFNLNGSGDLSYSGQAQRLLAQSKGSGNIELDVGSIEHVELIAAGTGDIVAIGKVKTVSTVSTGSGGVDTQRLIAQHADVVSNGTGTVKVYANKEVTVTATGSGDVEIYGNPANKQINKTGVGEVNSN